MGLQLANNEVVPQVHQVDPLDARPVHGFPCQPGDGLRRHLLPQPVRDHHVGRDALPALRPAAQAGLGLRLQGNGPVRQTELVL